VASSGEASGGAGATAGGAGTRSSGRSSGHGRAEQLQEQWGGVREQRQEERSVRQSGRWTGDELTGY
jgi:hypothetical protein